MSADEGTRPYHNTEGDEPRDPLGLIGWVIAGKYKVQTYLGGGGFSEVYEGINVNLPEQRLAIKFFKRMAAREKFAKEAKILCLLDHPNICRVIDYLPDEGAMVVSFISGKDGGRILKDSGPLPEKLFLKVARAITSAMAYAHNKRIAHRDIKPGNIIVDQNEHVYLIDFGIAKELREDATKTGYQALTPMFAAPERQKGDVAYNPYLSDVYEIGAALFNLATNDVPYRNPVIPNIREWGGEAAQRLSPQLTRILRKATHPDPERRYQSVQELHDDLQKLTLAYKKSRMVRNALVTAAIVVVAGLGYWGISFISSSSSEPTLPARFPDTTQTATPQKTTPAQKPVVVPAQEDKSKASVDSVRTGSAVTRKDSAVKPVVLTTPQSSAPAPKTSVPTETKPLETKAPVKELPPTVPSTVKLLVQVIPENDVALTVDGTPRKPNNAFDAKPGTYPITVTQPELSYLSRQCCGFGGTVGRTSGSGGTIC